MKLRRRFASSLRPLFAHRTRTLLALSGVGIGVAAVIVSRAIGVGAQREMTQTIERLGTNLLIVKPLSVKRLVSRREMRGFATTLTPDDFAAIARLPFVHEAAPGVEAGLRVKRGPVAMKTTVRGTTAVYPSVRRFRVAAGRFFDAGDDEAARRVAVLGARVNETLQQTGSLLGEEIRIRGVPFDVIGILEAKGTSTDGGDEDNQVLVPAQTALRRVFNVTWLSSIYVGVGEPSRMAETERTIERLLRERHRSPPDGGADDFAVQDTTKTRLMQQEITAALSRYTAGLAAIALLVGGIGIMALMLLSVRERTSEIGLRMAVGALPGDILAQFLIEASSLALAGWLAGLVLAGLAATGLAFGTQWTLGVPWGAMLGSFGMAVVIGLGFGSVPAWKAAQIPPIQALLRT